MRLHQILPEEMLLTVIILFCITLSLEWIAGIEMDGRGRRNKTELRTNKRIQEKRGFDNLHTNTNKLNRADDRRVAQPLRYSFNTFIYWH